jgi:hypothetical protein
MATYRPICDIWFLARARLKNGEKYYGAYLGGFPERARALLGCRINEPVLHVCGGMAREYPYKRGFGPNDKTMDLDKRCQPDFLRDVRIDSWPKGFLHNGREKLWAAILIDPPYSEEDAAHYRAGSSRYPKPNLLVKKAIDTLGIGKRVGIIHYVLPSPPKNALFVASVGVLCGFNNRIRVFAVFEKTKG